MIEFTIVKRGLLPGEEGELKNLQPRLHSRQTVDAVKFQEHSPWGTVMSHDTLEYALGEVRRIMMHEMREGKAVTLPGIGTFRLGLKGRVEVRNGNYHGADVHVDDIRFQPDRQLLRDVCAFEVNQVPVGQSFEVDERFVEERLTALFAKHESVTHKQVFHALDGEVTSHRVTSLLTRLVGEGRLLREGNRSQTHYRAVEGHFGHQ